MLTHPTLDTLRALKPDGMAEAFTELQTQDGAFACACRVIDGPAITHPNIRGAGYFH